MKRSYFNIIKRLIVMIRPLLFNMFFAITLGVLGHLCACFILIFGTAMVLEYLGFSFVLNESQLLACIVIMGLARGFLKYGEQSNNHLIAFRLLAIIRNHTFVALRKLAPAKLDGKDKGDLISLITSDIELLEVFYAHTISPVCIAIIVSGIITIFIFQYHLFLGLIALLAYLTIGILVPIYISKQTKGISVRGKAGELSTYVLENLRGLSEILQYQATVKRLDGLILKSNELVQEDQKLKKITADNLSSADFLVYFFDLLMLVVGIRLYISGAIEFNGLLLSEIALMSSFGPVLALSALGSTLRNTFESADRVLDILDEKPIVEEVTDFNEIDFSNFTIRELSFKYDTEEILSNINLDIQKDSIVGIIGKSGSGKSTLLKLLMRFYDPSQGRITIGDTPLAKVNTQNLRKMESFVEQDTYLFNDTIENNIRIAKLDATMEEIEEACKKASIHDFIMTLPHGYATKTGELGDSLSGGEKQRIGLARAFLHGAPVILLDEPTSNLDSLNEAIVLKSLKDASDEKTIILVSHRPSTLKITNQQISIENGRIS